MRMMFSGREKISQEADEEIEISKTPLDLPNPVQ